MVSGGGGKGTEMVVGTENQRLGRRQRMGGRGENERGSIDEG